MYMPHERRFLSKHLREAEITLPNNDDSYNLVCLDCLITINTNAAIKNIIRSVGKINEITGTEPKKTNTSNVMPKISNTEYTISTYMIIVPITKNINAASRVLDHNIMAKNDATAPKIKRLDMNIACPVSMILLSIFSG
jgi:hypothetical protein